MIENEVGKFPNAIFDTRGRGLDRRDRTEGEFHWIALGMLDDR